MHLHLSGGRPKIAEMNKKLFLFLIVFSCSGLLMAQKKQTEPADPISDIPDYDALFNELDAFLDSILSPRSYTIASINAGTGFFDYAASNNKLVTARKWVFAPTVGYFDKSGFGINASANILKEEKGFNAYQFAATLSYDYLKNLDFAGGVSATRYFNKENLDFYTSPLKNELYGYFTYRKPWFRPAIAASYGWGSKTSYQQQEDYVRKLRLRKRSYTVINTRESVADFNIMVSARHDFYWLDVINTNSFVRLTPQLAFNCGTQKFGFNQTATTYRQNLLNGKNREQSENTNLDDQMKFQPLSIAASLRSELSVGKFFVQPQLALNYYIPAPEKNLSSIFSVNTGFVF